MSFNVDKVLNFSVPHCPNSESSAEIVIVSQLELDMTVAEHYCKGLVHPPATPKILLKQLFMSP